jgi:hypothetical protein
MSGAGWPSLNCLLPLPARPLRLRRSGGHGRARLPCLALASECHNAIADTTSAETETQIATQPRNPVPQFSRRRCSYSPAMRSAVRIDHPAMNS